MSNFSLPPFLSNFSAKLCNPLSLGRSSQDLVKFDSNLEQSLYTIGSIGLAYLTWGIPHVAYELIHWQNNVAVYHTGKDLITIAIDIMTITIPPHVIKITRIIVNLFQIEETNGSKKGAIKRLMTEEEEAAYKKEKKEKAEQALIEQQRLQEAKKERMFKLMNSPNKGKTPLRCLQDA